MKYGLSEEQLQETIAFIRKYPEVERAVLFGSRAIGTFKEASDVDIALFGAQVTAGLAAKLKFDIEEDTYLPFFFDFIAYPCITNEALREHIDTKGVVLFGRKGDGDLREGWRECKLGEVICSNVSSITKDYPYKIIQYLDTGSITEGKIEGYQELSLNEAPSRAKRLVNKDDIVYSTVRPIQRHYGFIKNPPKNLVVSTGFSVIETNKKYAEPLFIYHLLTADDVVEYLDTIAEGSTSAYPSLKPSDIENLDILLPPISEQRAIASVLSSLDDKINLLHRQNKTLENLAEALFRQWFMEEADENCLGNYVSIVDNRGKTPPFIEFETPYPVIEVNALGNENRLVNYSVIKKYVDKETFDNWFRNKLNKYDTLISTVGSIGNISMYIICDGNIAQNVIGLHAENISPYYLYQVLKYKTDEMMQFDIGGVQPSIKVPHLLSMNIIIPSVSKQKMFDNQVSGYIDKMEINYKQIRNLEKLRDMLLPKLMSGEISLTEVEKNNIIGQKG